MTELEIFRHSHGIDPRMHIWGWEIPVYLFLGGMAAGVMILSALAGRRFGASSSRALRLLPFAAPVLLSIGMLALFLDLEAKLHVFRFYFVWRLSSPMSWGSWILLAIYPATILLGLARTTEGDLARWPRLAPLRRWAVERERSLELTNVALGVALGTYTGILLGTLGARALWNSPVLGFLFLASGFSSAAALVLLAPTRHEEHQWARRWDAAAIVVEVGLLAAWLAGLFTAGAAGRNAAAVFFGGPWTAVFWILVVFAGLAIPLAMEMSEEGARRAGVVAPVLVLAGGLALRWILVAAGQAV